MNDTALLPPCYLPPVGYLSVLMRYERVIIDVHEHYVKQTYRNRCYVASPHGPTALTVPVAHPSPPPAMCEATLSEHGNWRHVHLTALDSYYRHTPYYDYYRERSRWQTMTSACCASSANWRASGGAPS